MRITNLQRGVLTSVAAGVLLLAGCSDQQTPVSAPDQAALSFSLASAAPDTIVDYEVRFDGRVYDGEQTTFTYTVSGTGVGEDLTHFMIELPPCAPELSDHSPESGVSIHTDELTDIYGIEWSLPVGADGDPVQTYSITFSGDVPLGVVRGKVIRGSIISIGSMIAFGPATGVGSIPGPCAGSAISGVVFIDVDSNLVQGPAELGIENVTVTLSDADGHTDHQLTDANGAYLFMAIDGTYTVRIDPVTPAVDFNEELASHFDATTPTSRIVTVGPDSPGNDFGYKPRTQKLIDDLRSGVLTTDGRSVNFWRHELLRAITGNGQSVYTADELLAFIETIESLALYPYEFTEGHELEEAHAILSINPKDDDDIDIERITVKGGLNTTGIGDDDESRLRRELLATEFNHAAGRGLDDLTLQYVLISWGEGLLIPAPEVPTLRIGDGPLPIERTPLEDGGDLFKQINGATGGGGTN